jgi:hypothetical protein
MLSRRRRFRFDDLKILSGLFTNRLKSEEQFDSETSGWPNTNICIPAPGEAFVLASKV